MGSGSDASADLGSRYAKALRSFCTRLGLNQTQAGYYLGIPRSTIRRWWYGSRIRRRSGTRFLALLQIVEEQQKLLGSQQAPASLSTAPYLRRLAASGARHPGEVFALFHGLCGVVTYQIWFHTRYQQVSEPRARYQVGEDPYRVVCNFYTYGTQPSKKYEVVLKATPEGDTSLQLSELEPATRTLYRVAPITDAGIRQVANHVRSQSSKSPSRR